MEGRIFITGGAGFLGRSIMRRAIREKWPCEFTVYSRDEQKHVSARDKGYVANYVMGDVDDMFMLERAMEGHDTVIHTAAIKYIPECETQARAATQANVVGTMNVLKASYGCYVDNTVVISTDKAAHPINIYGMTKGLCEGLVREYDNPWRRVVACRYGNVIGSTGSIWPVAKAQIVRDGYISITNPEMTRFFMTVDDAVDLIVASLNAPSGSVVLPKPRAMSMAALADTLAKHFDVSWKCVGPRPGEKLHEDMLGPLEHSRVVDFGSYYRLAPSGTGPYTFVDHMTSNDPHEWLSPDEFVSAAYQAELI